MGSDPFDQRWAYLNVGPPIVLWGGSEFSWVKGGHKEIVAATGDVTDVLVGHILDRGAGRSSLGHVPGVDAAHMVRHVLDLSGKTRVQFVRHPLGHGSGRVLDHLLGMYDRRDERVKLPDYAEAVVAALEGRPC
jgi:hypothetical protein